MPVPGERTSAQPRPIVIEEPGSRAAAWTMILAGALGTVMAALLLMEKIAVIQDPTHVPVCSINPVLSCGSVITTWQASIIGDIPNPVLGLVGFPLVIGAGAATLAGARLARWYWYALLAGVLTGVVLIHWLAWQSLYVIGALCPYCMLVWLATMIILAATLTQLARLRLIPARVGALAPSGLVYWVGLIVVLAVLRFWDYWSTLIP